MTDLMQFLFDYTLENLMRDLLPREYHCRSQRLLETREQALLKTLTPEQWNLFDDYQSALNACSVSEHEAMFQATLALARSLRTL